MTDTVVPPPLWRPRRFAPVCFAPDFRHPFFFFVSPNCCAHICLATGFSPQLVSPTRLFRSRLFVPRFFALDVPPTVVSPPSLCPRFCRRMDGPNYGMDGPKFDMDDPKYEMDDPNYESCAVPTLF